MNWCNLICGAIKKLAVSCTCFVSISERIQSIGWCGSNDSNRVAALATQNAFASHNSGQNKWKPHRGLCQVCLITSVYAYHCAYLQQ